MSTQDPNRVIGQTTVEMGHNFNTESQIRSNADIYNAGTRSQQQIHEEYNSGKNIATVERLIGEGRARGIEDEPKHKGEPVFIIGSGPSLDDSIKHLRNWKGGIICSPSHARTLLYHGAEPTHIMALDPFESWSELEGVDWSKTKTKLVTHPGVWPDLLENWPNEVLLYRQNIGRADSFYATTQRNMYSKREGDRNKSVFNFMIRTEMVVFASSPPLQLFVADRLGYGMTFLAGCDWAYHSGKDRFTEYTVKKPAQIVQTGNSPAVKIPMEWERHEHPFTPPDKPVAGQDLITTDNKLFTSPVLIYYKKNMISAWRLFARTIYTTDHGSVTEMPYMSIERAVATQGRKAKERSKEWVIKTSERYLARIGAWVVENEDAGKNFIETDDPEVDLNRWMVNMSRQYQCERCGSIGVAEDPNNHDGEACPVCKEGKIKQRHRIDIGKNMTRIRQLMKWVEKNGGSIAVPKMAQEKSGDAQTQFTPSVPQVEPIPAGD
jgi:DNA-directed RNA polymerase subunit RPC12/RpoP